ncbi:MAG: undecaprenyldiphospho-muramoylpentapeptide beta-N-acetylglucosaminyltransferase [Treponemataceae bacterium]
MITIAFTGGGTGGHIYPGLAVIERLRRKINCNVVWLGSNVGMDRSIVEGAGIEFIGIPSGKLRRYFTFRNALDVFKVFFGYIVSRSVLSRIKPALLFSKGGFVSVPPCAAAHGLKIPVFTHESDYSPGLATRLNSRWADTILVAYPQSISALPEAVRPRALSIGNPVRSAFKDADPDRGRRFLEVGSDDRILLVLGGSQGAKQVNDLVAANLAQLSEKYVVVHQTGPDQASAGPVSARYKPYQYIRDELPDVLAAAELVVGRSGAGTVWESAAAGKPMVLVPLCGSGTRGDQVENADYFQSIGAAISLVGSAATAEAFLSAIMRIADDASLRLSMAAASEQAYGSDAAEAAASLIVERLGGSK